jgi:hypothetical protein
MFLTINLNLMMKLGKKNRNEKDCYFKFLKVKFYGANTQIFKTPN